MANTIRILHRPKFSVMADGSDACLTMTEISSGKDGPTVGISGAIHGNEPTGSRDHPRLFRKVKDMPIKGRLLLLPVANPWAYAKNRRFTPIDELNLNREFPGDRERQLHPDARRRDHARVPREDRRPSRSSTPAPTGRRSTTSTSGTTRSCRAASDSKVLYRPHAGQGRHDVFSGTTKAVTLDRRNIPVLRDRTRRRHRRAEALCRARRRRRH